MMRDPILGQLDRDLACAIALGIVEAPRVVANAQVITLHDARMRSLGSLPSWLDTDDPLDQATRACLLARQEAIQAGAKNRGQGGWAASSAIKQREEANRRAIEAKNLAMQLLQQRGVLAAARAQGLRVMDG